LLRTQPPLPRRNANKGVAHDSADVSHENTTDPGEPTLTLDQAYRATYHFIHQYYLREPIDPFMLMLSSMGPWNEDGPLRQTDDPATWNDWMKSVRAALASDTLPPLGDVKHFPKA
jgi:hypothetical protein